jgi:hypothetical protein
MYPKGILDQVNGLHKDEDGASQGCGGKFWMNLAGSCRTLNVTYK